VAKACTRAVDIARLNDVERRAIQAEFLRRERAKQSRVARYDPTQRELDLAKQLKSQWFPQQRDFFESPARRKVAFCTRRAGKTRGLAIKYLSSLLENPTSLHFYAAQTSGAAKLFLWPDLKRLIEEYDLPFKPNETDLTIKHLRGLGMIVLKGADKEDEIQKYRGAKWMFAAIDEAQSIGPFIEKLVSEVLGASLRDQMGTLVLTGTAGMIKAGLFYEACHELRRRKSDKMPVYELHKWSLQDNPFLPEDAKNEDLIIDDEGFSGVDDPRFLREFRGIWAVGETERMFSGFSEERNVFDGPLPAEHDWRYVLGCDFGWHDESAMCVLAWSRTCSVVHVCEGWGKSQLFTDQIADQIMNFRQEYGATRYVGDTGGYGKAIVMHLQRDYGINVEQAQKREKLDHIAFINSAFKRGDVKLHKTKCARLIQQLQEVAWNDSKTNAGAHERDDLAFAMVYGWRACKSSGAGRETLKRVKAEDPMRAFALKEKQDALRKAPDRDRSAQWDHYVAGREGPSRTSWSTWDQAHQIRATRTRV
jgi:hypothetical protein